MVCVVGVAMVFVVGVVFEMIIVNSIITISIIITTIITSTTITIIITSIVVVIIVGVEVGEGSGGDIMHRGSDAGRNEGRSEEGGWAQAPGAPWSCGRRWCSPSMWNPASLVKVWCGCLWWNVVRNLLIH